MAAIVKANANLTSGGMALIKSSISAGDAGQMFYDVEYLCLEQYAARWANSFRSGSIPPTPLPPKLLSFRLTKQPTLSNLQTETLNGLTYFRATYSVGIATDVVETVSSEQRNLSYTNRRGEACSFDYISYSVTISATNNEIVRKSGSVGAIFNAFNCSPETIATGRSTQVFATTIESAVRTKQPSGEYIVSYTSTGVYFAKQVRVRVPDQDDDGSEEPAYGRFEFSNIYNKIYPSGTSWAGYG